MKQMSGTSAVSNPFSLGDYIGKKYFCDRKYELEQIVQSIANNRNMVVISPRRLGKTGLIRRTFDEDFIKDNYYTFYIDIYATSSLTEFVYLLGKNIYNTLRPHEMLLKKFVQTLASLRLSFTLDANSNPEFHLSLGDIKSPETTLDELFDYLEDADRPCVIAIDEFQQIANYAEKNVEALLRTKIQHCRNSHFLYAGSRHHLMSQIFMSPSKPFYMSAVAMGLNPLHPEIYTEFATRLFEECGRYIEPEAVMRAYELSDGITWFMQALMNYAFSSTPPSGTCRCDDVERSLQKLLMMQDMSYSETMGNLSIKQKQVLLAIASETRAEGITSASFIAKHNLPSASSVQSAIRPLVEKEIVYQEENVYMVYDRFFGEWLRRNY